MNWFIVNTVLNVGSALAAYAAAMLWYKSAVVKVPHSAVLDPDGFSPASISVEGNDFIATATAQSVWSKRAALVAAVAAFLQGTALLTANWVT